VAVAVGVGGVEQRQLLHAHCRLPFIEVVGESHAPELLEEPRAIERGHPHCDGHAVALRYDRTVDAPLDGERHLTQRAAMSLHLDHVVQHVELPDRAVEHVSAVLQRG